MADCGAAGSALDQAASALVSSAFYSTGDGSRALAEAGAAAVRAASSLAGKTVSTAAGPPCVAGGVGLMPPAPPERLVLPAATTPPSAVAKGHPAAAHVGGAWDDSASCPVPSAHSMAMMARPPHPHGMVLPPPVAHQQQQQHQAMQMHMRQMQMIQAQVMQTQMMQAQQTWVQKTSHQQKLKPHAQAREHTKSGSSPVVLEKDMSNKGVPENYAEEVAARDAIRGQGRSTGGDLDKHDLRNYRRNVHADDDDYLDNDYLDNAGSAVGNSDGAEWGHDGYTEPATIERLAQAWAEAEEEYARELEATATGELGTFAASEGAAHDADLATDLSAAAVDARGTEEALHPYEFGLESEARRPDLENPDVDLFAEGMRCFDAGDIADAILSFESLLRHVDPDHADAWRMLGLCHAENDEDRRAIACLERAVERDPYNPESLLALGVSYVNELDHSRALRCLRDWITHNPSYAGMEMPPPMETGAAEVALGVGAGAEANTMDELKDLLRQAMEHCPSESSEALEALGVVCNVSREYDVAIDALRSAAESRPSDHQLWNRLGATLANAGRSEEALPSYQRALGLKPKYARAWLNLAISHSNLRNYGEAARCYLQALSLNPGADHVWGYLRIALTCAERWDLLPFAAGRNLMAFEEHFDFVRY